MQLTPQLTCVWVVMQVATLAGAWPPCGSRTSPPGLCTVLMADLFEGTPRHVHARLGPQQLHGALRMSHH